LEKLKNRATPSQSKNKFVNMVELYEQYIDDSIFTIKIESSVRYIVNNIWVVDISTNKVTRCYNDPE